VAEKTGRIENATQEQVTERTNHNQSTVRSTSLFLPIPRDHFQPTKRNSKLTRSSSSLELAVTREATTLTQRGGCAQHTAVCSPAALHRNVSCVPNILHTGEAFQRGGFCIQSPYPTPRASQNVRCCVSDSCISGHASEIRLAPTSLLSVSRRLGVRSLHARVAR